MTAFLGTEFSIKCDRRKPGYTFYKTYI